MIPARGGGSFAMTGLTRAQPRRWHTRARGCALSQELMWHSARAALLRPAKERLGQVGAEAEGRRHHARTRC